MKNSSIDWENLPELPEEIMQMQGACAVSDEDIANDDRFAHVMSK